jgi:hypothetical protein
VNVNITAFASCSTMQTTSPPESQLTVNTAINQLVNKICLSIFLPMGKEDMARQINFLNTMIYEYFSLKKDLISNG